MLNIFIVRVFSAWRQFEAFGEYARDMLKNYCLEAGAYYFHPSMARVIISDRDRSGQDPSMSSRELALKCSYASDGLTAQKLR